MSNTNRPTSSPTGPAITGVGLLLCAMMVGGCGSLSFLPTGVGPGSDNATATAMETTIAGDVTLTADTGLPRTLAGTASEQLEGTYNEDILQVFFDEQGAPIAAVSRSLFTVESPDPGTITSVNLIIIVDTMLSIDAAGEMLLDEQGNPIPVGLITAATGDIIHGTGAFDGATGQLHADSTVLFGGGAFGLGSLDSDVVLSIDP